MAEPCYRHPERQTSVACSSCGRPICPDCMSPTPVGMRCPECTRQTTPVRSGPEAFAANAAPATMVLIGLNVAAYLLEIVGGSGGVRVTGSSVVADFGLRGVSVADGEWYRLLSGGFLHASLLHIGFNMFALFLLGRLLEPAIGTPRFIAVYFASLFAGSCGALMLTDPYVTTVGASGAVFGLFGAAFLIARGRGFNALASQLGFILLFNLAFTFGVSGISVGGHLGGLAGGLICAAILTAGERGALGPRPRAIELTAMAAVGVVAIGIGVSVS